MNKHAQALGKLAKGRPKVISEADRERRIKQGSEALNRYNMKRKAQLNSPCT